MSRARSLLSVGSVICLASSALGDVIVVPSGSPANAIATAVAGASNGDVILVHAGTYSGFVINGKGVGVVAHAGANVQITTEVGVINVPANLDVMLAGLTGVGTENNGPVNPPPNFADGNGLYLFDNAGSVRVIECDFTGGRGDTDSTGQSSSGGSGMALNNSLDVVASGTTLRGGLGGGCATCWISSGGNGGRAFRSINSFAAIFNGSMHGGLGGLAGESAGNGGHGAEVGGGRMMFASNSIFEGGNGANATGCTDPFFCCHGDLAGNGGNGLQLTSDAAAQILADVFTGGEGGFASCGVKHGGPGADVIQQGAAGLFTFTVVPRILEMPRIAREGDVITLSFSGLAGDDVSVLFAQGTAFEPIPSRRGILVPQHIGIGPERWLRLGKIASTSTPLTHSMTVPELGPGVDSRTWHVQFMVRNTAGIVLGSYSAIVYLDASL